MAVNTHVQPAGAGSHFATKLDYKAPGKELVPSPRPPGKIS